MKGILGKFGIAIAIIVVIGIFADTGSAVPPDNALVYIDSVARVYYPPSRAPDIQRLKATSYSSAKRMGAKPDDPTGFNIDGPPLIISLLVSAGIISNWPSYWTGTNAPVEYYESEISQ